MTRWPLLLLLLAALVTGAPAAHGQAKDTLTVALVSHAFTLDPHMHFERVGILVNINMFDSLLHKNAKLEYEPSLATSWKALNDTTWEFKLRQGVKFHDGSPFGADDVVFTFERAPNVPNSPSSAAGSGCADGSTYTGRAPPERGRGRVRSRLWLTSTGAAPRPCP